MKKGFLVTFEGGEGCGKSCQVKKLIEYLKSQNLQFVYLREPGGTLLGDAIRKILLESNFNISAVSELFLLSAGRHANVEEIIKPALQDGKIVIMDRFYDSSYAYQGYAGNLDIQSIEEITKIAVNGIYPNLTFLLDLSYEEGMKRKKLDAKLSNLDRIESKGKDYHDKVRNGYLEIAKKNPDRFVVIDASKKEEEIAKFIRDTFDERYKKQ